MTNKEAKQEAIKKAYGQLYEKLKNRIDHDGFLEFTNRTKEEEQSTHPIHLGLNPDKDVDWNGTKWRPVQLRGVWRNNGWTRIEPDGSNLPKLGKYLWLTKNGVLYEETFDPKNQAHVNNAISGCSHYKEYEEQKLPVW